MVAARYGEGLAGGGDEHGAVLARPQVEHHARPVGLVAHVVLLTTMLEVELGGVEAGCGRHRGEAVEGAARA